MLANVRSQYRTARTRGIHHTFHFKVNETIHELKGYVAAQSLEITGPGVPLIQLLWFEYFHSFHIQNGADFESGRIFEE